jgi:iron complex transport system substrate-binding protein
MKDAGLRLVELERKRLDGVKKRVAHCTRKSVAVLEWTDPLFAMGNWGPELVEVASGELVVGRKGEYSAAIRGEQLQEADPEWLIIAPCGFNMERSLSERPVLERNPWWPELRAVRLGNVAFADGNLFFNRSGMTVARTAEMTAEILHGVSFGEPTKGRYWRTIAA